MAGTENFTPDERAAMKERAAEVRASRKKAGKDPEPEVLARIAELPEADRVLAERLHALIREAAPELTPRMWYGQPAYARDGKVVVFLQPATKFKTRYSTLGFSDEARLDDGAMWPTSWALTSLSGADSTPLPSWSSAQQADLESFAPLTKLLRDR